MRIYGLLLLFVCHVAFAASTPAVQIGVLAKRGDAIALKRWSDTAHFLETKIKEYDFTVVPLDFDEIDSAVRRNEVDFLIANSAIYVRLEHRYKISRIATLLNKSSKQTYVSHFGGVLFTKSQNKIDTIDDLKDVTFGAVDPTSFGGWIMARKLFYDRGIKPEKYFKKLKFFGTHDAVVQAVLQGKVQAGTVRTDTLERMAKEGKIDQSDFFVINRVTGHRFPFAVSTPLYPEWPIAKMPGTKAAVAKKVALALMAMPPSSKAAQNAGVGGWTIPANYAKVDNTLQTLGLGPYTLTPQEQLARFVEKYFVFIVFAVSVLVVIIVLLVSLWRLNRNLQYSKARLQESNRDLESQVSKRTGSIESLLEKEKYLRQIMATVSDINRYLITYKQLPTLLQKSCERLVKPDMYKLGFITIEGVARSQRWFGSSKGWYQKLEAFLQEEFEQSRGIARHFEEKKSYEIINDVRTYDLDEQFRALCLDAGIKACAFFALKPDVDSAVHNGVVGILSDSEKGFELEEIKMLEELSGDLGFAIEASLHASEHERLKNEQIKNYEETILSFVKMIEQRDTYTAGHTTRVARYCTMIARQMGLEQSQVQKLEKAAILHDIGKVSTPDAVLLKPGRLDDLEYKMIKEHVSVGYDMLKGIGAYSDLAKIMRHHHERYDGSGYPDGLAGDEIPLLSAIMSVADAFDAMTSTRIYKKSKSVSEALKEIRQLSGGQFHPKAADAAAKALSEVTPPSAAQQTPTNEIERERLAYFYKDAQTGLYNESYLTVMLTQNESLLDQSYIYCIHTQNAVQMQLKEGVKTIENSLAEVAKLLQKRYELVFFVKPADFYIFTQNDYGKALDEFVQSLEFDGLEFILSRVQKEELKKSFLS